jgi:dimethylamine/trimethylamine dehydrogenase
MARAFGVQIEEISFKKALKMWPPMRTDDDHYYMGSVLAEHLANHGCEVTLLTPAPMVSYWTQFTMEQHRIQARLMHKGVRLYPQNILSTIRADSVTLSNTVSGLETDLPCDAVLLVSDRLPDDVVYQDLKPALAEKKLSSLRVIGDAQAPDIIAQATFSGYLAAAEFDETIPEGTPFKIEYIEV